MQYLVTTDLNRLPSTPVAMVDGTVPGYSPRKGDYHFDHHRVGGADIQIDEMDAPFYGGFGAIVTTQVDADACVAAAWLQLAVEGIPDSEIRKLRAIAYDCDHLQVPDELADLADFAAQAVAALKSEGFKVAVEMGLPEDRREWTDDQRHDYYARGFKQGTEWLIDAVLGKRPYPGELGESAEYWNEVKLCEGQILSENRIRFYRGCVIVDLRGIHKYVDPRAPLAAIKRQPLSRQHPVTLTWSTREAGYKYTLADAGQGDLTKGTFAALSQAERTRNPDFDSWGGRKTVGGSSWNHYSLLEPHEVIDIVLATNH